VAHIGLRERRLVQVAEGIVADFADGNDPGHAARHLVHGEAVHMRVKPVRTGRVIGRDVDPVIRKSHDDRTVLVGTLRHRYAIGRVVDVHENVIAEGRIAQGRRPRLDDQAVGVDVGRVQRQIGPAGILRIRQHHRIDARKLVHEAELQLVALLQCQPDAAVIGRGGRSGRALVPGRRRARADLIDPAGRVDHPAAGRHVGDARHRLRQRDDQEIEHAVRTREYRRLDEGTGGRDARGRQQRRNRSHRTNRSMDGVSRLRKHEWHNLALVLL